MRRRTWKPHYAKLLVEDATNVSHRDAVLMRHGIDPSKKFIVRNNGRELVFIQWKDSSNYEADGGKAIPAEWFESMATYHKQPPQLEVG